MRPSIHGDLDQRIVDAVRKKPMTRVQLSAVLDVRYGTLHKHLQELERIGAIRRTPIPLKVGGGKEYLIRATQGLKAPPESVETGWLKRPTFAILESHWGHPVKPQELAVGDARVRIAPESLPDYG
jgi:hypothetical protein